MPRHTDTKRPEPAAKSEGYVDVDRLENADKLVCTISQRKYDGAYTFAVMRMYEKNGNLVPTAFVPEYLMNSYIALLELARTRIAVLRSQSSNVKAVVP